MLAFVARRLYADAIAMIFAVRDPSPIRQAFEGLPDLRLEGLGERALQESLTTAQRMFAAVEEVWGALPVPGRKKWKPIRQN